MLSRFETFRVQSYSSSVNPEMTVLSTLHEYIFELEVLTKAQLGPKAATIQAIVATLPLYTHGFGEDERICLTTALANTSGFCIFSFQSITRQSGMHHFGMKKRGLRTCFFCPTL